MKTKQTIGWGLAFILVALILAIAIHNMRGSSAAHRQEILASPSPTAIPTTVLESTQTVTPEILFTETVTPEQIPLCTFNVQEQRPSSTPSLDAYVFSEPKVVLTSTTAIRLLRWLPDNRRLLIGQAIEGKFGDYIETFDLQIGEITRYSEWWDGQGTPLWLSSEQAVVFVSSAPPDYVRKLYLAHGQGLPVEELAARLATPLLSLGPDGRRIIFSSELQGVRSLQFQQTSTSEPLVTNLPGQIGAEWPYLDAWRADGSMVAMHRRGTFYLVDRKSETVCEVDLGGAEEQKVWAIEAKWSPDGRYIAALVTIGEPPFRSINLMIIDTLTRSRQIDFGGRSVHSIDWSPNGNTLLITVQADPDKTKINLDSFYLVDVTTGDSKLILPEHKFFAAGYYGALWSPDSKTIGLSCSDAVPPDEVAEWRVCIVSVELKP